MNATECKFNFSNLFYQLTDGSTMGGLLLVPRRRLTCSKLTIETPEQSVKSVQS